MLLHRCRPVAAFAVCFVVRAVVHSIRRCGPDLCRDEQVCCAQGNNATAVTCCQPIVDKTYYNIAMVTRKLSGVLIMLLLFAVGYFVQRVLCSRSRPLTPPHSGHPAATTSQEPLVEGCAPGGSRDPAPAAQLPTYDECKRLPTYEETVREGSRGRPQFSMGKAT
ncbi:hypothetical protein F2P81_000616 [Scophthalmus maximus]|uniref:Uncharacterized protein n=1 Tax=Scophthalmus maximus TaxID=52904 RepID=A0A6A4TLJ6_SCOMX|nr:hypothetical protein F2P81_000616 [Scophthalmus maximus]